MCRCVTEEKGSNPAAFTRKVDAWIIREKMIVDEGIVAFINSLETKNCDLLEKIEEEALEAFVPIISKESQSLLKVILKIHKPMRILEVGTAVGFSSLLMSENAPKGCKITTIENYHKRIPVATTNFKRMGKENDITLIQGDAKEELKRLDGVYDFIFMDAAKGQYINYFPDILRLLKTGGILLSDNVLFDGSIVLPREEIVKRNRTIYDRLREYLHLLKNHHELETSIIPIGDGMALSYRL